MPTESFETWARNNNDPFIMENARQWVAAHLARHVMPKVLRPIPPAWASKARTYGAYKRMVIRRIGA